MITYQAIIPAAHFAVGIMCSETHILRLHYLNPQHNPSVAPQNALAKKVEEAIQAYLKDPHYRFQLPLAPAGTPFQQAVWKTIAEIPCQKTQTYGEIAKRIKSAPRAVGQACGSNPYPLIVPCHRVISATGALGGFAHQPDGFFVGIKAWLLAHEAALKPKA